MNTRRTWVAAGAALPALAWMDALRAQAVGPLVIGWLVPIGRGDGRTLRAFHEGMAALGWKEGTQYVLEARHAEGRAERLPELAQELAAKKPAVIVVITSAAARVAAAAAPNTPIVVAIGEPLSSGLVTNPARPGGMFTGLSNVSREMDLKCIELLVACMPKLKRIGVVVDTSVSTHAELSGRARAAAEQLKVQAVIAELARPEDIEPAVARLAKSGVEALIVLAGVWLVRFHAQIIALAMAQRWPVGGTPSSIPRAGGLFNYGPDSTALVRRSAYYVDRILKGTKPGDLPIELPATFQLVINMKTAKQLGITVPRLVLAQATELIE